ncbi:hypothetical protein [Hungatella hathewayi]|uniref:hypothetical protein n=1 Tax=Hungatella hathewayi TaxID=154046 RepID=UPI0022E26D20|nr:hypothetical protein [Hungatella hathewayi]
MKKFLCYGYFFTCFFMMFSMTSYAYIDPSVLSYTIQIVAGVAIAIGAAVGIYWRKAKRKINDKLGIDENAKKEMENDIIETDED